MEIGGGVPNRAVGRYSRLGIPASIPAAILRVRPHGPVMDGMSSSSAYTGDIGKMGRNPFPSDALHEGRGCDEKERFVIPDIPEKP